MVQHGSSLGMNVWNFLVWYSDSFYMNGIIRPKLGWKWCINRNDAYGVIGAISGNESPLMIGPWLYKPNFWWNISLDFHQKYNCIFCRVLESSTWTSRFLFFKNLKFWNIFRTNDKFGSKSKFNGKVSGLGLISDALYFQPAGVRWSPWTEGLKDATVVWTTVLDKLRWTLVTILPEWVVFSFKVTFTGFNADNLNKSVVFGYVQPY